MNSYQNKNEYEILDASRNNSNMSNRYPRYPLANDQQASMQNTNYKDWLATQGGIPVPFSTPSQLLKVAGNIVPRILGILPTFLPGIGPLVPFLTFFTSLLWPSGSSGNDIWEKLMKEVADLIDQKLEENILRQATANLAGLQGLLRSYNSAFASWEAGNATPELVKGYIESLHRTFVQDIIGSFTIPGYEKILLPTYAIAANFHLMLLRDIEIYGGKKTPEGKDGLNFDPKDLNFYNCELKRNMEQYKNYCLNTYNKGLASEKEKGWVPFHRYRREMTLAVLDIIALFPLYDARLYPAKNNKEMPVKSELTREIYSDVINSDRFGVVPPYNYAQNEERYTRPPHLFTWLRGLDFVTNVLTSGTWVYRWSVLTGCQNKYSYTKGNGTITGPFRGYPVESGGRTSNITIEEGSYIYNLLPRSFEYISPWYFTTNIAMITFLLTNNNSSTEKVYGFLKGNANLPTVQTDFDFVTNKELTGPPTYNNYNHILSHMLLGYDWNQTGGIGTHGYTFAFTHSSVDPYNTIAPDKITQIPAVKAFALESTAYVSAGPGHTGGDVVNLPYPGRLKIRLTPAPKNKNYRVRIRYASTGGGTFKLQIWTPSGAKDHTFVLPATGSPNSFFNVDTLVTTTLDQPGVEIILQNISLSYPLFTIDKVELIPIDIPIDKCTECQYVGEVCTCSCPTLQSLDTEKEIVNSLFVE
ncbi:insecticidal delta-endotoxin Cry8Ea1 family protein [Bacillus thuringiensis]|uniref:insecticidal delta-endotoxin Cry8Ea1 family protein n=1 Tax=Bacillus thuringiensis TaxID=1428 RepID=UPI003D107884|nr:insecticidal toxin protein [Bacillus thuringiensis]